MSVILSIYTVSEFKEYFLPTINNSNYKLVLDRELFGIQEDFNLDLEVIDDNWFIRKTAFNVGVFKNYEFSKPLFEGQLIKFMIGKKVFTILINIVDKRLDNTKKVSLANLSQITIGSTENNDVQYSGYRLVSKSHAVLKKSGSSWVVEDVSKNGIFSQSRIIGKTYTLKPGDCLNIFGLRVIYYGSFIAFNAINNSFGSGAVLL